MLEHRGRRLAFGAVGVWRLTGGRLEQAIEGRPAIVVPLARVERIRLSHDPVYRGRDDRYRCDIVWDGGPALAIPSLVFRPLGSENTNPSYRRLITALVPAVARANPACRFECGRGHLHSLYFALVGPGAGLAALAAGLTVEMTGTDLQWFAGSVLATGTAASLPMAWRQWPRRFDPAAIPPEILPRPEA